MKLIVISALLLLAFSCGTNKDLQASSQQKEVKKGTVILLSKRTKEGLLEEKEYYFRFNSKNYFIKLSESTIEKKELAKLVDKETCLIGTINNGPWEREKPSSLSGGDHQEKVRSGLYVAIDAFVKCP